MFECCHDQVVVGYNQKTVKPFNCMNVGHDKLAREGYGGLQMLKAADTNLVEISRWLYKRGTQTIFLSLLLWLTFLSLITLSVFLAPRLP